MSKAPGPPSLLDAQLEALRPTLSRSTLRVARLSIAFETASKMNLRQQFRNRSGKCNAFVKKGDDIGQELS